MDTRVWRTLSSWVVSHPFRIGLVLIAAGGIVLTGVFGDIVTRGGDGDVVDALCIAALLAATLALFVVWLYVRNKDL